MSNILIAGCGDLGSGLAIELIDQGHEVTGIRRTGTDFPKGVKGVTHDLLTIEETLLPDVDVVFLIMTPNGRNEASYRSAYFDTAQVIIRRYQKTLKPPQVFFVSSTSVYGQSQGEWIDEQTVAMPNSPTAKVLFETEQALAAALPSTSIRCSGIYGSGRFRLLEKIANAGEWGKNSWTNRIHRDDVVSALAMLTKMAFGHENLPEHVIVTDQTPVSMWEVKLWLATHLGAKVAVSDIDSFIPSSGKRIQGQFLLSKGWRPNYPSYTAGYQSLLQEYQEQKLN